MASEDQIEGDQPEQHGPEQRRRRHPAGGPPDDPGRRGGGSPVAGRSRRRATAVRTAAAAMPDTTQATAQRLATPGSRRPGRTATQSRVASGSAMLATR